MGERSADRAGLGGGLRGDRPSRITTERLVWFFVALGLATRLVRYLVAYPLWHDEAFVAANLIHRGFLDLLRPLDYNQVAPAAFLAIELGLVRVLGFTELSLRLFPLVCSLGGVLAFERLSRWVLRGPARVAAVAILAVSVYSIRYAAEVKPYGGDLLASAVMLGLAARWLSDPARIRPLVWLSVVTPLFLAISYPAVLVASGIVLVILPEALRSDRRGVRLAALIFSIVAGAVFLAIYFGVTFVQSDAVRLHYRQGYWRDAFPNWERPWQIPLWLISVHTGTPMAYPFGGERGASSLTLIACVAGAVVLRRTGRTRMLKLLLAPVLMGLVAAALGRYPYGGAPRLTQYLAPTICILTGAGLGALFDHLAQRGVAHGGARIALTLALLAGASEITRDIVWPYRVIGDRQTRDFARWFWTEFAREADLVCLREDLHIDHRQPLWRCGMSAVYLCHRAMFAKSPAPDSLALATSLGTRPMRLVIYDEIPHDDLAIQQLIQRLGRDCAVGQPHEYVVAPGKPGSMWLRDRYIVLPIEPRTVIARDQGFGLSITR